MDMRIPPLKIKIMLEPNPPKPRIFVRRLAVCLRLACERWLVPVRSEGARRAPPPMAQANGPHRGRRRAARPPSSSAMAAGLTDDAFLLSVTWETPAPLAE